MLSQWETITWENMGKFILDLNFFYIVTRFLLPLLQGLFEYGPDCIEFFLVIGKFYAIQFKLCTYLQHFFNCAIYLTIIVYILPTIVSKVQMYV